MSEHLDSYLMSIGMALSKKEIDVNRAVQLLSAPEIVEHVDGSNVQQLIRLSLMTAQIDPSSAVIAEVGVLLGLVKPSLEIDFGLQTGVANAQSCALFAMYSIVLQEGKLPAALAVLQNMISSLTEANDRKGLLETFCWTGVLYDECEDYANAATAISAAIGLLDEPETAEALLDNSALDMVREDNKNVFSFPKLRFLQFDQIANLSSELRQMLNSIKSKQS